MGFEVALAASGASDPDVPMDATFHGGSNDTGDNIFPQCRRYHCQHRQKAVHGCQRHRRLIFWQCQLHWRLESPANISLPNPENEK